MVNIAAVSGPLIGIVFGLNSQKSTFFFTALSYVPFFLFIVLRIPTIKIHGEIKLKDKIDTELDTWHVIRIILKDRAFIVALISNVLFFIIYAQMESVVPQYLLVLDTMRAVNLVTVMLVTNAITVLISQFYLEPISK